ncbi:MAG: ABC transporter ATP-binding protein [Pyrinomonadaceae bacterium]
MSQSTPTLIPEEQALPADVELRALQSGLSPLDSGLTVNRLRKSFSSPSGAPLRVLDGLSFVIAQGEVIAITGASGAGKSTLLHLLGGLEAADEGSVLLGNIDITATPASRLAKVRNQEIGFVFQFHHLLPDLTAIENVAMPLLIGRTPRVESLKRAARLLESLGLLERSDHPIKQLSGGEQQRVAIARALVKEPRLVLADEPSGNLDTPTADEIAAVLLAYARSRKAIIIIATHNERLAALCDRTLVLAGGKVHPPGHVNG